MQLAEAIEQALYDNGISESDARAHKTNEMI